MRHVVLILPLAVLLVVPPAASFAGDGEDAKAAVAVSLAAAGDHALPPGAEVRPAQAPASPQAPTRVNGSDGCHCGYTFECVCPPGECQCDYGKACEYTRRQAPISWDEYRWEAFATKDVLLELYPQCKLMRDGKQVGTWTWQDRKFWPVVNGRLSDVPTAPPIPPPYSPTYFSPPRSSPAVPQFAPAPAPVRAAPPAFSYAPAPSFAAPSFGGGNCRGGG